jgi:hypothetical protein
MNNMAVGVLPASRRSFADNRFFFPAENEGELTSYTVTADYTHWNAEEVLNAVLPVENSHDVRMDARGGCTTTSRRWVSVD